MIYDELKSLPAIKFFQEKVSPYMSLGEIPAEQITIGDLEHLEILVKAKTIGSYELRHDKKTMVFSPLPAGFALQTLLNIIW